MDDKDKAIEDNINEMPQPVEVNDLNQSEVENNPETSMGESIEVRNESSDIDNIESMEATQPSEEPVNYSEQPIGPEMQPEETPVMQAESDVPVIETASTTKEKKPMSSIFKIIMVLFVGWLFIAAPVGAYLWRDRAAYDVEQQKNIEIAELNNKVTDLEDKLAAEVAKSTGACSEVTASPSAIENIKASITSGNTAALEGYMASGVDLILAASEGIGETNPANAVSNITSFIEGEESWNFALTEAILDGYQAGDYKQYFPDTAVVGRSAGGKVISFSFDCTAKIGTVLLVTTDSVL